MKKNLLIGGVVLLGIIGTVWALSERDVDTKAENMTTPPSLTAETTLGEPNETGTPTSTASEVTPGETAYPAAPSDTKPAASGPSLGSPVPSIPSVPAVPSKAPYVATIYYDGSRFIPETVTVPQGATVLFENASDRLLWVAANPHPSHIRYTLKTPNDCAGSAFDQCKAMKKGETWSFTFSELGEWKYHNHMREVDEGEVTVLSKEKYLKYEKEQSTKR